ncbi:N-acetylmuramoyl-L-alanine amidase [Frankia sp. Cj3]|uniref:peptidoglycan recognition protein family protein n=1 Tax=Frankia sp. Cj3 TaxID=2880976 RepID=UPI001EF71263|nr:N-acetylmuramoyl-L-alanine amidase [Frankia sp. Cj3]
MSHLVPTFTYRPVCNTAGDAIRPMGLVLHVQEGNNSPYGWFNNPASQASSSLWAGKAGEREQYVPSDVRAWAQGAGNTVYCSIETEGYPAELLTDAQIETVAQAYADGVRTWGWALHVTDTPGMSGLITHSAGGAAWGNHPGCPGPVRAGQRQQIIDRAREILAAPATGGEHVDLEQYTAYGFGSFAEMIRGGADRKGGLVATLRDAYNAAAAARDAAARIETALAQMPATGQPRPLTVDDVLAAIGRATDPAALARIVQIASGRLADALRPTT